MKNFMIIRNRCPRQPLMALTLISMAALAHTSCTMCNRPTDSDSNHESQSSTASSTPSSPQSTPNAGGSPLQAEIKDLKIETLKEGTGAVAAAGKLVTVHYTGTLIDGKVFDSSETRKSPFQFTMGAGQVIKGWEKGVEGMKVGERRRLTIPSILGYGERGVGSIIPPNATLIFEVELLKVD